MLLSDQWKIANQTVNPSVLTKYHTAANNKELYRSR